MKLLISILTLTVILNAGQANDPISVGNISWTDAVWDNTFNVYNSRQKVGDLTREGKSVVLYLFEACFS